MEMPAAPVATAAISNLHEVFALSDEEALTLAPNAEKDPVQSRISLRLAQLAKRESAPAESERDVLHEMFVECVGSLQFADAHSKTDACSACCRALQMALLMMLESKYTSVTDAADLLVYLEGHPGAARWFLLILTDQRSASWWQFLFSVTISAAERQIFACFIIRAIRVVAPLERHLYVYDDPSKNLFDLEPEQRPHHCARTSQAAAVTTYIDFHLANLEDTRAHWQTFQQYWALTRELSQVGYAERKYLWSRRALFWVVDYYMGEFSHYTTTPARARERLGAYPVTIPNLQHLFWAMSSLVCHTRGVTDAPPPPTAYPEDISMPCGDMDPSSGRLFSSPELLQSLVRQAYNRAATVEMYTHFCWEHLLRTQEVCRATATAFARIPPEFQFMNVVDFFEPLCRIPDSIQRLRIQALLNPKAAAWPDEPDGVLSAMTQNRDELVGDRSLHKVVGVLVSLGLAEPEVEEYLHEVRAYWRWVEEELDGRLHNALLEDPASVFVCELLATRFNLQEFLYPHKML